MFETLIQSVAEVLPVVQNSVYDNAVAIFLALASIAGIIGKVILDRSKDSKTGKYMTTFGQKTAEQQEELYILSQALAAGSPEAKKFLEERYGKTVEVFKARALAAESQLKKLEAPLPSRMHANADTSIGEIETDAIDKEAAKRE